MPTYLRREQDRKDAILNDTPDTRFQFESQKFSDVPGYQHQSVENGFETTGWAAQEVQKNNDQIEAVAARFGIDADIVRAVIYTEIARGGLYGYPAQRTRFAHTILPGNIGSEWQALIPGSDVHNAEDNIQLTAKLLSRIAQRLDDPSIENIYSLYNGLGHDRTYINKETKNTPYYAKMAWKHKAWEKDNWSYPKFSEADDTPSATYPSVLSNGRFGEWSSVPANIGPVAPVDSENFADRFGEWATYPRKLNPVLGELSRYRISSAPAASTRHSSLEIRPPASASAIVRDSVRNAGIPNRNNVFEFGYPGMDGDGPSPSREAAPTPAQPLTGPARSTNGRLPSWYPSAPNASGMYQPQGLLGQIMDVLRPGGVTAGPEASVFQTGAPPVPLIPDDSDGSFADRFGDQPPLRRLVRVTPR